MSKKVRIEELERRVSHLVDKINILEDRLDDTHRHLDAMVRHYIALYERGQSTTTPTIVPSRQWPNPIPAGGLNIPFPFPLDSGTTSTPLPDPPYRVTCTANGGRSTGVGYSTAVASEPVLSSAWLSLDDDKAWGDL